MNLNRISLRFLFSEKKYSYTNISIYISALTFSLAIAISLVVMGISRSYKNDVESSLQSIEPEIIITPLLNQYMSTSHIDSVYIKLNSMSKSNSNLFFSKFREEYVMAKKSGASNGLIAYMLEDDISKFYTFLDNDGEVDNYMLASNSLLEKYDSNIDDEITLFNISKLIENETLKAISLQITGSYNSKIPTFDNNIVFLSKKMMGMLFDDKDSYSGIFIAGITSKELRTLKNELDHIPIVFTTWKEKHENILYWLTIFMNPILLIVFFILSLAIIYQIFSNWLILHDKSNSLYQLKLMGASDGKIKLIYLYVSLSILSISLIFGYIISIIFSYAQNKFNIINLDPSIYILNQINSNVLISDFILISIFSIIVVILSTLLSFKLKGNKLLTNM